MTQLIKKQMRDIPEPLKPNFYVPIPSQRGIEEIRNWFRRKILDFFKSAFKFK